MPPNNGIQKYNFNMTSSDQSRELLEGSTQVWFFYKFDWITYICLVLLQVPKCFVLVQISCVGPKIYLHIVAFTNILYQTKRWFAFSKIGFCASTKVSEEALNFVKCLGWLKIFGPVQNILGPVKGQGFNEGQFCKVRRDKPAE